VKGAISNKVFTYREMGINKIISTYTKSFSQELMVAHGNQLLTIIEKQDVKREGDLSQEEQVKLEALTNA